jgi:Spy/CpxP family protein refolding chaperone
MRTSVTVLRVAVAVVVAASVSVAMAQGQGGGRGRGGRGGGGFGISPTALLQNETVQKDLDLSDDQKAQVTKLAEEQAAQRGQGRGQGGQAGQDPTAARQAFQQAREDLMKKINDILLPNQQARFAEIMLQAQNVSQALADAKVAEKLTLTDDQKQKLTDLTTEYQQKRRDLFQAAQGGGGPPDQAEMTKLTTEENDKAKELLTAEQKTQFETMLGKKIDVDFAAMRNQGRGQRGRRGQGGQGNGQPAA